MAARSGRNNLVARRVINDLIDISRERSPLKYMKIFIEQQITDHHRFIASTRDEQDKVVDFNRLIAVPEERIHGKEIDLEMLEAEEEYFEEVKEDDENNHSNGNVVKRGITRKTQSIVFEFLGDLVYEQIGMKILSCKKVDSEAKDKLWDEITRYFDVDLTVKKLVMNRLGQLLRNFRRKFRQTYLLPNQNTLSKLNEVPTKYSAILKAKEWVNFVKYTATEEYKVKSAAAKMARSKSVYQHTMDEIEKRKEIKPDEEPAHDTLWLKGMKETEDKIKEGTLKVDHGTDAMTFVLGKEKGGYARVVGSEVTYNSYFDLPRSRQASDERILLLQSQLDNERRERQEKELLIQNLSNKMSQTERMVSPVDINPISSSADEEGGTTVVGCDNDASIQKSNGLATLEKEMEKRHFKKSTISPLGTVYKTDGKQMLHNKELPKDGYKVSIDTSLVDESCIPDVGNNSFKIVKDAVGGFFAWPKDQVVFDSKETPQSTIQMNVENKIAPKLQKKRKNVYVSSDAMQRQAKKKSLQKYLNY
uniref:DUF8039 domain-containing protein n=1 Tax=Tanacetum cinerariifolium TaxID=118510 RepID=A0A6L2J2B6_TANCI|nr:hypothetical protein [Tanacetum cinerariifolium]